MKRRIKEERESKETNEDVRSKETNETKSRIKGNKNKTKSRIKGNKEGGSRETKREGSKKMKE